MPCPAFAPFPPLPTCPHQRQPIVCSRGRPRLFAAADSPSAPPPAGDGPEDGSVVPPAPESLRGGGGEDQPKKPIDGRVIVEALRQSGLTSSALANPGFAKPSHELVVCDGTEPARFVYVEERDCIGCTHCATTARGTFFMEVDNGRARAYNQTGDSDRVVEEAIDTCPVNCIYYTTFEDLVILERERESQQINNDARLVDRGCKECPLYGVGENPVYQQRLAQREAKRRKKSAKDGTGPGEVVL